MCSTFFLNEMAYKYIDYIIVSVANITSLAMMAPLSCVQLLVTKP